MNCYVLRAEQPETVPTLVMFYGGGFCLNTLFAHKSFMAHTAAFMPCNIVLPDYPLAPETKAPASTAQLSQCLQTFLNSPTAYGLSENIVLLGWSSGGLIALTQALNLQKEAPRFFRKISQLVLLSAWMDLSLNVARTGPYQAQQNSDTIAVCPDMLERMAAWYLPDGYKGDGPEYCPARRPIDELKALPLTTGNRWWMRSFAWRFCFYSR